MTFMNEITNFLDVHELYKKVFCEFKNEGGSSLAVACERLLGQKLCKGE